MASDIKSGQELELKINSLAFGGRGVARRDGFVIFVEGALPGDRVRARVARARRSYAEARTLEVIEASGRRVEPACRHVGLCGGCAWQSLDYATQLEYKQRQVIECLQHIGGLEEFQTEPPLAAKPLWRYRNKVEFSFAPREGGSLDLGFHLPGQWRRVVDIEDCLLHSLETNRLRNAVRDFARACGNGAYDQQSGAGFWRHLVIREAANTGDIMVNLVTARGDFPRREDFVHLIASEFPRVASLVWSVNDTSAAVAGGFPFQVLAGRDHIRERILDLSLDLSPAAFLQTNTRMAERLYRKVLEFANPQADEDVFDLYCGVGSITLLLAQRCRRVTGIEISSQAVALARQNAEANGIGNATFHAGKVRAVLKKMLADDGGRHPGLTVMDPPRAGAGKRELERVAALGARRIVYVSCNASTMAGNIAQAAASGYRLRRVGAVDMFPQTPHVEAVALLERE